MKRSVLLPFLFAALATNAQTVLFEESFDTYTEGSGMVANDPAHWAIWVPGDDQVVSTAFAQSGTNSLACISDNPSDGGPGDLLLLLGDKITGTYDLGWSMYVPSGRGGYFNVQHAEDVTIPSFALEVSFGGGVVMAIADNDTVIGSYASDEWFDVLLNITIDDGGAALFMNNGSSITWPFDTETDGTPSDSHLGAIDFYSFGDGVDTGEYYVDDISYVQHGGSGIGMAESSTSTARVFPNPARDGLFVTVQEPLSQQASVQLVDMTGQPIAVPMTISGRTLRFRVGDLAPGIYFVRITDGDRRIVERAVKE